MTQVICDLDGVVYRGRTPLPGASRALQRLVEAVEDVYFVTNNSTRTPAAGAAEIEAITGVQVSPDMILTSSMAAMTMLTPADAPVLAVGESGVHEAVHSAGLVLTEEPMQARTVVVGLKRDITYDEIAAASVAVRNGARFVATNIDPTFPTEHGLMPGCGALVAAIATASGGEPEIAGKPHPPMRSLIRSRGVTRAWVIGDRIDTDMALADGQPGWVKVLVLTGVTTGEEAAGADIEHVVDDLGSAVDLVLDGMAG